MRTRGGKLMLRCSSVLVLAAAAAAVAIAEDASAGACAGNGNCGCGAVVVEVAQPCPPIESYLVNQGPVLSGPGTISASCRMRPPAATSIATPMWALSTAAIRMENLGRRPAIRAGSTVRSPAIPTRSLIPILAVALTGTGTGMLRGLLRYTTARLTDRSRGDRLVPYQGRHSGAPKRSGGEPEIHNHRPEGYGLCAGRPARSRWCKSTAMKE